MTTQFAFDLRLSRRKAGLTQGDCAHLLGIQQSRMSDFERGRQMPSLEELCGLAIILDRNFDALFAEEMKQARAALKARVISVPKNRRLNATTFNRVRTIHRLKRNLKAKRPQHGSA